MPELPEVQTVVNTLAPRIVGKRIAGARLLRGDIVTPSGFDLVGAISGRSVSDITRRAKRIVILLSDGNRFFVHLGMTGRLTIEKSSEPILKHTHLIIHFDDFEVRFRDPRRFGGVWWMGTDDPDGKLGPEPLEIRPKQLAERLGRTTRAIKNALLDQNLIAGLGNIYVDESLFAAGIHPLARADKLDDTQVAKLTRAIKLILRKALRHRGSTLRDYVDAEGGSGAFQNLHQVYDRAGKLCRVCKSPIVRIVLGGRSTCFCSKCQSRKKPTA